MYSGMVMDDDDTARLFRENDNLGADSSVFLRPMRRLLQEGAPPGELIPLFVSLPSNEARPFGALTCTSRNRIIFWPVLPRNADMIAAEGKVGVFDHVTLEL